MSMTVGEIVAYLKLKDEEFHAKLKHAGDKWGGLNSNLIKGTKAFAVGAGAALSGAVAMVMTFTDEASNLNETINKSGVVFGKSSKLVEAFGDRAAKSMGLSKRAAIEAASTYGNLFVGMKIGQQPAADMSTKLVQLAADLGSFNNVPVADALEAIQSGLVGETEPLRKFGVNLSDAELRAKAMAMGIYDGKGVLDSSQRALAAYNLMLQQTGTAQGDFERTSSGMANSQKTLSALWEDAKAKIGEELVPALTQFIQVAIADLPAVITVLGQVGSAVGTVAGWWVDALTNFERYRDATEEDSSNAEARAAKLASEGVDVSAIQQAKDTSQVVSFGGFGAHVKENDPGSSHPTSNQITFPVNLVYKANPKLIDNLAYEMAMKYTETTGDTLTDAANVKKTAEWLIALYKVDPTEAAKAAAELYLSTLKGELGGLFTGFHGQSAGARLQGHASGGVFSREHLAVISEQNSREAVVPLDNPRRKAEVMREAGLSGGQDLTPLVAAVGGLVDRVEDAISRVLILERQGAWRHG